MRRFAQTAGGLAVAIVAAACTATTDPVAGGRASSDAQPGTDTSTADSGTIAPADAGVSADAEAMDAGTILDAASASDASDPVDASPGDSGPPPADAGVPAGPDPVLFIHGVGGNSGEYAVMIDRLVADGWPRDELFAIDFDSPRWGCNVDNAETIRVKVEEIRNTTGHNRIDLVAHSMGTISSRYYIKALGGTAFVNTYVTLGGMHHGLRSPCWSPLNVCTWQELCETGEFIENLNADPATPGDLHWVSIYSVDDDTTPAASAHLDGAENIDLSGVTHAGQDGLLEHIDAFVEVRRVLQYPPW